MPKLISEYTPNSNSSADYADNENETQQTNTCSKSTAEKKFCCFYG